MKSFEQLLKKHAAPALLANGYLFSAGPKANPIAFDFRKNLTADVKTVIRFQRHQIDNRPGGYGFTVELMRGKTLDFVHWEQEESGLSVRLGHLLWYHFNLRVDDQPLQWWEAANPDGLIENIQDVIDKLVAYGIPWLEDPRSRNPWSIPEQFVQQFRKIQRDIARPQLEQVGYGFRSAPGNLSPFFLKALANDLYAIIQFELYYLLDDPRLEFGVILSRKATNSPYIYTSERQEASLNTTLDLLLRVKTGIRINASRATNFNYTSAEQLAARMQEAIELIKQYAIPWLEDLSSIDPLSG